jgi:lipoprotein-anchoring transpeptidase ErfK/SrfK
MSSTRSIRPVAGRIGRRAILAGLPLTLAACAFPGDLFLSTGAISPSYAALYGALPDERFPIPALDLGQIDPKVLRRMVSFSGPFAPDTIVVQTARRHVYLVGEDGRAMRYGVGVGREGFEFDGEAVIARKAQWPRWTPTQDMIARDPARYAPWAGGMDPGLQNPLGARALYLFRNGRDTLYRLHGTNEPWSIGLAVSSGCIRLFNHDVIDLYERVPVNTRVVVLDPGDARVFDA